MHFFSDKDRILIVLFIAVVLFIVVVLLLLLLTSAASSSSQSSSNVSGGPRVGGPGAPGQHRLTGAAPHYDSLLPPQAVVVRALGLLLQLGAGRARVGGPQQDVAAAVANPPAGAGAQTEPPGGPERHLAVQRRLWGGGARGRTGG